MPGLCGGRSLSGTEQRAGSWAIRCLVLLEAIRATGSREEAFRLLGLEKLLDNRNHHRRLHHDVEILRDIYGRLGVAPPDTPG